MDIFRVEYAGYLPYGFTNIYLCVLLLISSFTDFKNQKIPNYLTFPSMLTGVIYYFISGGITGFFFSLAGLFTGFFLLIIPHVLGGMGAGDVKLLAAVGAFLGAKGVFLSFLLTALFGGLYAIVVIFYYKDIFKDFFKNFFNTALALILTKKYMPEPIIEHKDKPRLCYGIAIALGTFTYMGMTISGYEFLF